MITGCGWNETTCSRRSISGAQPVDERDEDREARVERALVAAEALDDAGARPAERSGPSAPDTMTTSSATTTATISATM